MPLEVDISVDLSEQRMVLATADVHSWLDPGSALANDNSSSTNSLAAVALYAQPFGMAIAAVSRRPATFFMCHRGILLDLSLRLDRVNAQACVFLAMPLFDAIALLGAVLEDDHLAALAVLDHSCHHGGAL